MKEVIISNSSLNSYGFRVLTEGIDTAQFERNPILLWMHNRPMRGTTDEVLPLGRVENLRRSAPGAAPNQIYVTFLPAAAPILADLDLAVQDMDRIRLADFSDDDLTQYEQLSSRIAQNIQRVLGESRF